MNYHLEGFGKLTFRVLAYRQSFLKFILQFNLHSFRTAFFVVTCMLITSSSTFFFCFVLGATTEFRASKCKLLKLCWTRQITMAAFFVKIIGGPVFCSLAPLKDSVLVCFFFLFCCCCLFIIFLWAKSIIHKFWVHSVNRWYCVSCS